MHSSDLPRRSRGLAFAVVVPAAIALVAATASGSSRFHAHLAKSIPAAADTVDAPPTIIRLWFTEKPEPSVSSVALVGPAGTKVPVEKPRRDAKEEKELTAKVTGAMKPGAYRVDWRTMGVDGHPVRGSFTFVVSARASASSRTPAPRAAERDAARSVDAP